MYSSLLTLVLTFSLSLGTKSQLQAEYSSTVLPRGLQGTASYYDGDDKIYIFGGQSESGYYMDEVLLYRISSDTLELVGHLPNSAGYGSVQPMEKNVLYFGGEGGSGVGVYRYDLESNSGEVLPRLPYAVRLGSTERYKYNTTDILILGGQGRRNSIRRFSTQDFTSEEVGRLKREYSSLGSVRIGDKVYIMGDAVGGSVQVLDLLTMETTLTENVLPDITYYLTNLVWDGRWVWVMGGWRNGSEKTEGILKLDSETLTYEFISVGGYPVGGISYWWVAPSSVYVPRVNRIYCFGGQVFNGTYTYLDKIFWIDLDPFYPSRKSPPTQITTDLTTTLGPDIFNFECHPDGNSPSP